MLKVEGSSNQVISTTSSYSLPGPSSSSRFSQPTYSHPKKDGRCNVKIVQAEMSLDESRKPVFDKLGQVFIDVTETTANITYITSFIQQKFGLDHVIVTGDGLKIEDSPGTQG